MGQDPAAANQESRDTADPSDCVVLGLEPASAIAAEEARKAKRQSAPSPMPEGEYDFWRGETSLLRPTPLALDTAITLVCERFAAADPTARAPFRAAISMDEFYTLITFARRAAVFAIRRRDPRWVNLGTIAIAMIDCERVDYRDILTALGLLYHAAERAGMKSARVFEEAAARSDPQVATLFTGFLKRSARDRDIRLAWGFEEVETEQGIGFIGWGFQKYRPTYDLKGLAIAIGDRLNADKYLGGSIEVATDFPDCWLRGGDALALQRALKSIRAGATVHGYLRPNESPTHDDQYLIVFLVELARESACRALLEIARQAKPSDHCMVPIADARLFCLIVARSIMEGVDAFKSQESLARSAQPMADVIHHYVMM